MDFKGLGDWLRAQAGASAAVGAPKKRLLVQAYGALTARDLTQVYALAADAGFGGVLVATGDAAAER